jgi:hypothetical protein
VHDLRAIISRATSTMTDGTKFVNTMMKLLLSYTYVCDHNAGGTKM